MPDSPWLTSSDAAEYLRFENEKSFLRLVRNPLDPIPGYKIGKGWRFFREELDEWVKRHRAEEDGSLPEMVEDILQKGKPPKNSLL